LLNNPKQSKKGRNASEHETAEELGVKSKRTSALRSWEKKRRGVVRKRKLIEKRVKLRIKQKGRIGSL